MKEEVWKDIAGYEGLYQVSNLGKVKSLNYKNSGYPKVLKNSLSKIGYYRVSLYKIKRKQFNIHRLVADAFVENPDNKKYVDHINTIKTDNRAENLRFVTMTENNNNPITKIKMSISGKKRPPISNLTREKLKLFGYTRKSKNRTRRVICIDSGVIYESQHEAERKTGIHANSISMVCNGKRNHCKNTHWRFYDN